MNQLADFNHKYLYLFADCYPVKGFTRTALCDISRQKIYFVDNSYFELISELRLKTIDQIVLLLEDEDDKIYFYNFITFLLDNELGIIVDDITLFPEIKLEWDHPSTIVNAIIDVRDDLHDFKKIFDELDELGCYDVQIRAYKHLYNKTIRAILAMAKATNFRSVELLNAYRPDNFDLPESLAIVKEYAFAQLTFHSFVPEPSSNITLAHLNQSHDRLLVLEQSIDSCHACGIINKYTLGIRDIKGFTENIKFNGCLNRKISVDESGFIKNCPSMAKNYGHVSETSLTTIAKDENFRKAWSINKDSINVCRDCEFRYVCTDCRAYTVDDDLHSKPLKCGYDPYTGKWENNDISVETVFQA